MDEVVELDVSRPTDRRIFETGNNITISVDNKPALSKNQDSVDDTLKKETIRKRGVCRFYSRDGKCSHGSKCKFDHDIISNPQQPAVENSVDPSLENVEECDDSYSDLKISSPVTKQCRFFILRQGCKYGDDCQYNHYRSVANAGEEPPFDEEPTFENVVRETNGNFVLENDHFHQSESFIDGGSLHDGQHLTVTIKEADLETEVYRPKINRNEHAEVHHTEETQIKDMTDRESCNPEVTTDQKSCNPVQSCKTKSESLSRNSASEKSDSDHESKTNFKICRYFLMSGGCRMKEKCKFKHQKPIVNVVNGESVVAPDKNKITEGDEIDLNVMKEYGQSDGHVIENSKKQMEQAEVKEIVVENNHTMASNNSEQHNKKVDTTANKKKIRIRMCRYFNSASGCKDLQCKFLHEEFSLSHNVNSKGEIKTAVEKIIRKTNDSNVDEDIPNCNKNDKEAERDMSVSDALDQSNSQSNTINNIPEKYDTQDSGPKKKCRYVNQLRGCRNKSCPYLHEKVQLVENHSDKSETEVEKSKASFVETEQNKEVLDTSEKSKKQSDKLSEERNAICRFYQLRRGCIKGKNCPYKHVLSVTRINNQKLPLKSLRETELRQLETRFRKKCTLKQKEPSTIYSLLIEPSDPDWPFIIRELRLEIEFPVEYPTELFKLSVEECENYPPGFCIYLMEGIESWIEERKENRDEKDLAFRPFLKWFDKNIRELFVIAATKVKIEQQAQEAGITLVPHNKILANRFNNKTTTQPAVESEIRSENTPEASNVMHVDNTTNLEEKAKTFMNASDNIISHEKESGLSVKVKKGTEIKFSHLVLSESIGTLKLPNIQLTIACGRCKTRLDVGLCEKKSSSTVCKRCHTQHTVVYHSEFMHQYSPVVGYLHMQGCSAFDLILNDSKLVVNCLNCNKDDVIKGMTYGSKRDHWCNTCNYKIEIQVQSTRFHHVQSGERVGDVKKTSEAVKKKSVKDPSVKDGEPLPDNGTCKHYKKSYRWLRFPCCGKLYPCDLCHEEKEENDHEMKFASRMVCGYCSKEQPFAKEKPCIRCAANLTRSKSAHWEGGKGCRNKTKMARDDRHKTAGAGKTISRNKAAEQEKKKK